MKVLALVILVIGSSSGLGSGPYLPSGWRPSGPAFNLPTEVEKPVAAPLKEVAVQETETSGSSFLREYGPPKTQVEETVTTKSQEESGTSSSDTLNVQVSQDLTQQALPDPITEQAFLLIEAKFSPDEANAEVTPEAKTEELVKTEEIAKTKELTSDVETATATESLTTEEEVTQSEALIELKSDVETQTESSLAVEEEATAAAITEEKTETILEVEVANTDITKQETTNGNSNIEAVVAEKKEELAEVEAAERGVQNIAEALVNLEKEIKAEQVQANDEVTELRTIVQETTGSVQNAPEGFLEYGPPELKEYGPPKSDLKTLVLSEEQPSITSNEINEARRRRFSPKFKIHRKQ